MSERVYIVIGVVLFLFFVLKAIYLFLSHDLVIRGGELSTLHAAMHEYDLENHALEVQIWQNEAYRVIEQKARAQGFIEGN